MQLNQLVIDLQVAGMSRLQLSARSRLILDDVISAAFAFFRLPLARKQESRFADECGFRAFGAEYSESPARPDQIESFSVCGRMIGLESNTGPPEGLVLRSRMLDAFVDLERIVEDVASQLATSLGRGGPSLQGHIRDWSRMQLNYSKTDRRACGTHS